MGTHEYEDDPRNSEVIISVNGDLVERSEAKVSVFDAGFLLGMEFGNLSDCTMAIWLSSMTI